MKFSTETKCFLASACIVLPAVAEEISVAPGGETTPIDAPNIMSEKFSFANAQNSSLEETQFLIIGGNTVSAADRYPWFVALPQASGAQDPPTCGGSLIAPNVVLSAAHCADGRTPSLVGQTVAVGAYQRPFTSDGSQTAMVVEQLFSPGYNFGVSVPTPNVLKNDFMLLRLDRDILLDDYMRLSNYEEDLEPGIFTTAIGFGLINPPPSTEQPEFLQEAFQAVWFDGDCEIVYGSQPSPFIVDGDVEVCVGGRTVMEVANGDSGGPVFLEVDGHYYQVGVVSWSEPNKIDPGVPDVMAQIPLNEDGFDWIRQTVCGDFGVEATFCIPCEDSCDCPDNYECICYEEIDSGRRRQLKETLGFLDEGFLSPDHTGEEDNDYDHSLQKSGGDNAQWDKPTKRGRRMKSDKSNSDSGSRSSSKSCKDGKVGKQCSSDESGYCFRSDTSLVDDFSGKKSSSSDD